MIQNRSLRPAVLLGCALAGAALLAAAASGAAQAASAHWEVVAARHPPISNPKSRV